MGRTRRRRGRSGRILAALSLVVALGPVAATESETGLPDLSRLEPAVAGQIEELARVVEALEAQGAEPGRRAEAHGALGHLYVVYELPQAAEDAYRRAAELVPDDPRWPYYLGYLHSRLGELDAARDSFRAVVERDPDDLAARLRLGRVELERNDPEAARRQFRLVLERRPESAAALYGLGRVAQSQGEDEEAVHHLQRAVALQPDAGLAHYALAQAYRRLGRLDDARRALEGYREASVDFPDPRIDRLAELSTRAVFDQVMALAASPESFSDERFLDHAMGLLATRRSAAEQIDARLAEAGLDAPTRGRLHALAGQLLVFHDRDEDAVERFTRALGEDPELDAARDRLANALMRLGRPEEALQHLSVLVDHRPEAVHLRLKRAAAAMALERFEAARADLERVVRVAPDHAEAHHRMGAVLERLGQPREAAYHYARAGRLNTSPRRAARATYEAARLWAGLGEADRALEAFERSRDLDPNLLDTRLGLGGLLLNLGRAEAAHRELQRAVELDPDNARARVGEAISLLALERWPAAARRLEEGVTRLPEDPALQLLLSRLRSAAPDASVRDGERALELARALHRSRSSVRSAEAQALALAELGRFDEAARWLRQALEAVRRAGDARWARSLEEVLSEVEAGRPFRAAGPSDLIVLP